MNWYVHDGMYLIQAVSRYSAAREFLAWRERTYAEFMPAEGEDEREVWTLEVASRLRVADDVTGGLPH